MIGSLSARRTPYHGLPAGGKLLALCGFCSGVTLANTPALPAAAGLLVLLAALGAGGWFLAAILRDLKWPALMAAMIVAWHGWNGTVLAGATLAATLLTCIAAATFLSRTTSPAELLGAVDRFLARLGVPQTPRRRFALAVALTLRFVPALTVRGGRLIDTHRARSPRRLSWRIIPPLALGALDEADHTAEALRARAYTQ